MSGLDQMMQRIAENAQAQVSGITANAQAEAERILAEAEAERTARSAEIAEKSARDAAAYRARVAASLEQQRRTALLSAKQTLIAELLEKSYETLLDMPADGYFAFLKKVLARYVQPEKGEICFSRRDLDRMPKGYLEELQAIAARQGGSLTLSGEQRTMDGGFILIYGGIEENCTIRALFDARRETLQDQVHGLLFA